MGIGGFQESFLYIINNNNNNNNKDANTGAFLQDCVDILSSLYVTTRDYMHHPMAECF